MDNKQILKELNKPSILVDKLVFLSGVLIGLVFGIIGASLILGV